ncbi:hypothetical protein [Azospirillum brasilense]|uniref:hypothetical protein n=1 Tax=Azospirillum brasilense TaxID=192 RepID=UPI000E686857|nr:hypothetical protein [Azospirillum brasilense]NUB24430.1 hypothetical protein [Azospirillum brasilense]NUB34378.1 hypothetical protein [Azospirillum brasilense]RIW08441.1 hypothetical protein D2T81_01670 [Azospirillum brasilense]
MATVVMMKHPQTGLTKKGFVGFSWTTLFFGGFPALFRGDWVIGLVLIILSVVTWGIAGIIAAFLYNKHYTTKLIESGYQFADTEALNTIARAKLGVGTASVAPSLS